VWEVTSQDDLSQTDGVFACGVDVCALAPSLTGESVKLKGKLQERASAERADESLVLRRHESGTIPIARMRASHAPLPVQPRVLVVGIVPTLTWSVARSLMLAGHKPIVLGGHRSSPMQLFPGVQYLQWENVRWFDDELDPLLVDQVEEICQDLLIDCVLPADYPTSVLLSEYGYGIRSARVAAVPHPGLMRVMHNKWELSLILRRLGLPQPHTELAADASSLAATSLEFPIVTKPVDRWGGLGFQVHHSRDQLEQRIVEGGLASDYPLLVQEYIAGQDVGFAFLARDGQLVAHACFEQPVRGSRRYFDAPRLRQYVATLLRETGYHGVGQIDTRYDPATDDYKLLEVNPRFWASIVYAAHAGMNFPDLLLNLDRLPTNVGFTGQMVPVRLSLFELAASRSMLLAEELYNSMLRARSA
jgi:predicted ATP-grasp superfamily ATP-dependent carboligase